MTQLESAIVRVLENWCEAEAGSYDGQTTLRNLWTRRHPVSPPYEKNGVPKLVGDIHEDSFLSNCDAAQSIGVGFFLPGGGIQTVGDLHDFLNPCGE
jgi:hypothetical protein